MLVRPGSKFRTKLHLARTRIKTRIEVHRFPLDCRPLVNFILELFLLIILFRVSFIELMQNFALKLSFLTKLIFTLEVTLIKLSDLEI